MMTLQFMLPDVPGLGVWELTTTSKNSSLNIRGTIQLVRYATGGRIKFIPLKLALGPQEVVPPKGKKKTVWIVHLRQDFKLSDLQQAAIISPERSFLPPGSMLALPEPDTANAPEDLVGPFETEEEGTGTSYTPEGAELTPSVPPGGQAVMSSGAKGETKPAAKETKKGKTETAAKPAGDPSVLEADLELGAGAWDKLFSVKVYKTFKITSLDQLTPDQRKTISQWIKAEKSRKTMKENAEAAKGATVTETPAEAPPAEKNGDPPPATAKKWADMTEPEREIMRKRQEFTRILSEDAGMSRQMAIVWMKEKLGVANTEGMTMQELEAAIDKAKAKAAESVTF
jgi:hypothetical protein